MANRDAPNGFRPQRALNGGNWTALVRRYQVGNASSDSTNNHGDIYIGDPVKLSSGKALAANSGDTILGVVVGVGKASATWGEVGPFDPTTLSSALYVPYGETSADSDWYVWVVPADFVLFEVQSASDLDSVAGAELDFSTDANEAHGSRTNGISTAELVADVNSDVMVVETVRSPDNDTTLANTRYIVRFRDTANMAADPAT